jgi:hypothetical protein
VSEKAWSLVERVWVAKLWDEMRKLRIEDELVKKSAAIFAET